MKPQEFKESFDWLISAFPHKDIPSQTWKVYYEMLKDVPLDVFQAASATCLARHDFFPSIRQLREAASEYHGKIRGLPDAYGAWGEVLEGLSEVAYGDPEVHPLIEKCVRDIGGWKYLTESTMIAADRARFIDVYRERLSRYRETEVIAPSELIEGLVKTMSAERRKELTDDRNDLSDSD